MSNLPVELVSDDEELISGVRHIAQRAIEEADKILTHGSPAIKIRLISSLFGKLSQMMTNQPPGHLEDLRQEFQAMMAETRDVAPVGERHERPV